MPAISWSVSGALRRARYAGYATRCASEDPLDRHTLYAVRTRHLTVGHTHTSRTKDRAKVRIHRLHHSVQSVSLIPSILYSTGTGGFLGRHSDSRTRCACAARASRAHAFRPEPPRRFTRWRLGAPSLPAASTPAAAPPCRQCTRLLACASVACDCHPCQVLTDTCLLRAASAVWRTAATLCARCPAVRQLLGA